MKKLFIFTSFYPYGLVQECFLEEEINYLVMEFDKVILIPYCYDVNIRKLPSKCEIVPTKPKNFYNYLKMIFNQKTFVSFWREFFNKKIYTSRIRFSAWLQAYCSTNFILNSKRYKDIFKKATAEDVFYFYWGKSANILSCFVQCQVKMVSRFHGQWDLWEEEYEDYAPMRKQIMSRLDATIAISSLGYHYIKNKYPDSKVSLFPLGSEDMGVCTGVLDDSVVNVLSCSTVYPLKRVDLIYRSLKLLHGKQIRWTHIGDGVDYNKIKKMTEEELHPSLEVNLIGRLSHEDVMYYLKKHKFDVFVNLSVLEGVPVSIMEAISFDIPVVATNVGGTSDIVTLECGVLVSQNPSEEEVANAIKHVLNQKYSTRQFWETHYSSKYNYSRFAKFLKQL